MNPESRLGTIPARRQDRRSIRNELGLVASGLSVAAKREDGFRVLKHPNLAPKPQNRVLELGVQVDVSHLLSISSFEMVLSFKL